MKTSSAPPSENGQGDSGRAMALGDGRSEGPRRPNAWNWTNKRVLDQEIRNQKKRIRMMQREEARLRALLKMSGVHRIMELEQKVSDKVIQAFMAHSNVECLFR